MIEEATIESVEGDRLFKVLHGSVRWSGNAARFRCVIYQSVGGPNVRAELEDEDVEKLVEQGVSRKELTELEMELQEKILNGEIKIGPS